jgi:hypothetical protein
MHLIEDAQVDAITIIPAPGPPDSYSIVAITVGDELSAIKHVLETVAWGHLDMCAKQSADGLGFGNDAGEALFAGNPDIDSDVEPFEGVLFKDLLDNTAIVSEAAFRRLMDRFFTVVIQIADDQALDVRADPRWPDFLMQAKRMRELAGPPGLALRPPAPAPLAALG